MSPGSSLARVPDFYAEGIERGKDDIVYFGEFFCDLVCHEGQEEWVEKSTEPINVLVPGNRWGKSRVTALKHLHKCAYKVGDQWHHFFFKDRTPSREEWLAAKYATINCSISADQAEIVFREAVELAGRPKMSPFIKEIRSTPFPHIVFRNGAIFHCRSTSDKGKYIDGHRYAYMSYDEAGWEPELDWLMGTVLLTRLMDWGGQMDVIGTPKGRGYLYSLAMKGLNGVDGYYTQQGSTYENVYLTKVEIEKLEERLFSISEKFARQSLYGDFVEVDGLCFTFDQVQGNMLDTSIEVHREALAHGSEYRVESRPPSPKNTYVAAFDLARRSDRTAGFVLDVTRKPFVLVRAIVLHGCPWEEQYEYIRRYGDLFSCLPLVDSTGLGDVVCEELEKRGIGFEPFDFNDGRGIVKERLVTNLQNALDLGRPMAGSTEDEDLEWGLLRTGLIPPLLEEMSVYQLEDRKLDTDCVMSLGMAVWKAFRSAVLPSAVKQTMRRRRSRR